MPSSREREVELSCPHVFKRFGGSACQWTEADQTNKPGPNKLFPSLPNQAPQRHHCRQIWTSQCACQPTTRAAGQERRCKQNLTTFMLRPRFKGIGQGGLEMYSITSLSLLQLECTEQHQPRRESRPSIVGAQMAQKAPQSGAAPGQGAEDQKVAMKFGGYQRTRLTKNPSAHTHHAELASSLTQSL